MLRNASLPGMQLLPQAHAIFSASKCTPFHGPRPTQRSAQLRTAAGPSSTWLT